MPTGIPKNLLGRTFGRLKVMAFAADKDTRRGRWWVCRCECGEEKVIRGDNLTSGRTTSCGCYLLDMQEGKIEGRRVGRRPGSKSKRVRKAPTEAAASARHDDPRHSAMIDF